MSRTVLPLRVAVLLVLAAASWGLGTVISKRAVAEIPPLSLLVVQLTTSVITLAFAELVARRQVGGGRTAAATHGGVTADTATTDPGFLDRLGLLNPGASYALRLIGPSQITASLSVLIWAVEPVLILILAWWWLRERVTRRLVGLSLTAALGMALLVWAPGAGGQVIGIAVTLAGVACCAVYTVLTRRRLAETAGAVVSGVVYYALAYGFYLAALRDVPASLAASAFYLIPVFGVAGGWLLLAERLDPVQWLGAAIVLVGVVGIARVAPGDALGEVSAVPRA